MIKPAISNWILVIFFQEEKQSLSFTKCKLAFSFLKYIPFTDGRNPNSKRRRKIAGLGQVALNFTQFSKMIGVHYRQRKITSESPHANWPTMRLINYK